MHVDELGAMKAREKVALFHDHSHVIPFKNDGLGERLHGVCDPKHKHSEEASHGRD